MNKKNKSIEHYSQHILSDWYYLLWIVCLLTWSSQFECSCFRSGRSEVNYPLSLSLWLLKSCMVIFKPKLNWFITIQNKSTAVCCWQLLRTLIIFHANQSLFYRVSKLIWIYEVFSTLDIVWNTTLIVCNSCKTVAKLFSMLIWVCFIM